MRLPSTRRFAQNLILSFPELRFWTVALQIDFRVADHPGVSPASVTSCGSAITTSSGAPTIKKQFKLRHSLPC